MDKVWFLPRIFFSAEGGSGGGDAPAAAPAAAADAAPAGDGLGTALADAFAGDAPAVEGDDAAPADDAGAEAEPAVDEPGAFEIAAPEGLEVFAADFASYGAAANEFLTANPAATARDALKWATEYQAAQVKDAGAAQRAQFENVVKQWDADARADADFGGANYDANVQSALAGVRAVGSPELVDILDQSGLGSHPAVLKAFAKIGKHAQESPILGGEGGKGNVSFANALYGKKG